MSEDDRLYSADGDDPYVHSRRPPFGPLRPAEDLKDAPIVAITDYDAAMDYLWGPPAPDLKKVLDDLVAMLNRGETESDVARCAVAALDPWLTPATGSVMRALIEEDETGESDCYTRD